MIKVLFLSNNSNAMPLFEWLQQRDNAIFFDGRLTLEYVKSIEPDIIVSYNYQYIIKEDVISYMKGNIVNLHISYLPWNKGSSPNFWSFIDNSPKGVTIHLIDKGLDTGAIIIQQEIFFDETLETFASSYKTLQRKIVELFQDNWHKIRSKNYLATKQNGAGSYHTKHDMDKFLAGKEFSYDMKIADFKQRYN